ncbi:MAG: hypothetical protein PHI40_07740 [Caldisericia bacterium]|nr:hypothetical protein [Caldisericia bacterium]
MPEREKLIDFIEKLPQKTVVNLIGVFVPFLTAPAEKMIDIVKDRYLDCYIWTIDFNEEKTMVDINLCYKNGTCLLIGREKNNKDSLKNKKIKPPKRRK